MTPDQQFIIELLKTFSPIVLGAVTLVLTYLNSRKLKQVDSSAKVAMLQNDALITQGQQLIERTDEIHKVTNGNLTQAKEDLKTAEHMIARLITKPPKGG